MSTNSPKVTVLISTYNRPDYLTETLESVVNQTMTDFEVLVINDGGVDVGPIVDSVKDPRFIYHHRTENQGKASCCNYGLAKARGRYIAYIDDDDIWYPNHLELLSKALDENPGVGAAYSDLYAVSCVKDEVSKKRYVLDKKIMVSRDFNREFMFYYNHVLHVSLMHRIEAAYRVGCYDPSIKVLIEWSLSRKLCMIYDYVYIPQVTGEYYMPVFKSDRISVVQRKNKNSYRHNLRKIRSSFPEEPWPKIDKVDVICPVSAWNKEAREHVGAIIDNFDYPIHIILINASGNTPIDQCWDSLDNLAELQNISIITPPGAMSSLKLFRFAAKRSSAQYVYLMTKNTQLKKVEKRIMVGLEYLKNNSCEGVKWNIEEENKSYFDILMNRNHFLARSDPDKKQKSLDVRSLSANIAPMTFRFDVLFARVKREVSKGDYKTAYQTLKEILAMPNGSPRIQFLINIFVRTCIGLKKYTTAQKELLALIKRGYEPDNWIRLGQVLQYMKKPLEAIKAYQKGLDNFELKDIDLENPVFPFNFPKDLAAFHALMGMAECYDEIGQKEDSFRNYRRAAKLRANSHRPFLGFVKHFLDSNQLDKAQAVSYKLCGRGAKNDPETHRVLGKLCYRKNEPEMAFSCYLKAFEHGKNDEKNIEPIFHTGRMLGKWEEVKNVLEKFVTIKPDHVPALARLSEVHFQLGNYERAAQLTRTGLELEKSNIILRNLDQKINKVIKTNTGLLDPLQIDATPDLTAQPDWPRTAVK
jgi:glycosyltransferase involved in cell wall biosynthesis